MRVVCLIVGPVLLLLGLTAIPRLVGRLGEDDGAYWLGRATVVAGELALGAWLLYLGLRPRPAPK